jgi:hypothetical protein
MVTHLKDQLSAHTKKLNNYGYIYVINLRVDPDK